MNVHDGILGAQSTPMRLHPGEIAEVVARLVVEEGLEYGPAKLRALKVLGVSGRTALPGNDVVEEAVRQYIAIFCAETQAIELQALRQLALEWMERMAAFQPYLSGAVWHGTATRRSDIHIALFCEDEKEAEIALIDMGVRYAPQTVMGLHAKPVEALSISQLCPALGEWVGVHLRVYDRNALRGALLADAKNHSPRRFGGGAAVVA